MSLGVEFTRLLPIYPNKIFFQWSLINPTEVGNYIFDLYRAGAPDGPWYEISMGNVDIYNYVDVLIATATLPAGTNVDPNVLALARGIYYRLVVTPPSGVANQVETVSIVEPKLSGRQFLLKRKMLRDASMMLRKLNGVEVAVCKRRHWGPRCSKCFDKSTKEVVRQNCPNCFGTGFDPGYFAPVITLARRGTAPISSQISPQGKTDTAMAHVTILDVPRVEEGDILVFLRDNKRFIIKQMMPTELQTVIVHQKLLASELARSAPEYRIPVDILRNPGLF